MEASKKWLNEISGLAILIPSMYRKTSLMWLNWTKAEQFVRNNEAKVAEERYMQNVMSCVVLMKIN
jgi:hypothetical protein